MSSVSAAATQSSLARAQVQSELSIRLMKIARENDGSKQMLELVEQTAESARAINQSGGHGRLDLYA